ncbi:hypothetical protein D3C86_1705740 [compost metagenome]
MVRSLPAATVDPKALDELRSVVLLLLLVPRLSLMLTPPTWSILLDEPGLAASAAAAALADD